MYRFIQKTQGKSERWTPINLKNIKDLDGRGYPLMTVLSVSAYGRNVEQSKVEYQGDLYFDIDNADISISISSAQQLVLKLQDYGVTSPSVWLSGKKGFHITVPAKVFSNGRPKTFLPYVYGLMAEALDVVGLDHSVYSGGKGRMWRQPNIQRADNNAYKVQITVDELFSLTGDSYRAYCSQPRPLIKMAKDAVSPDLTELFVDCSRQVLEAMENRENFVFEASDELAEIDHKTNPPTCLVSLLDGENVKAGANFNRAAMNLAGYIKVSGLDDDVVTSFVERLAEHNKYNSATYTTKESRIEHIHQHLRRAQYDPNMGFIPSYMFSTIKPCGGCVLCDGTLSGRAKSEQEHVEGNPIVVINDRYYVRKGEFDRLISTFVIEPTAYSILDEIDDSYRESIKVNVVYQQHDQRNVIPCELGESVWNSTTNFKKAVEGIGNAVWLGTDNDLMLLKHYIFSRELDMAEIAKTERIGLRVNKSAHGKLLVYVDDTGSLDSLGQRETHVLTRNVEGMPKAFEQEDFHADNEEHMNTLRALFEINSDYKLGLMIGWFMACHIKPHFDEYQNQFALLNLWGNSGAGKTKTASLLSYLHANDYEGYDNIASLGGTTPWAAAEHIASSTSTPRLLDEFNRAKLERSGKYAKIADMLKSAWGSQPHMRGSISNGKGAEVVSLKMSGAVCFMSEQQPDEPPIIQRSVQVNLNRKDRECSPHAFQFLYKNRKIISRLAKLFVAEAVRTPLAFVRERMEYWYDKIPDELILDSRPHYSYRQTLVGLDFMRKALEHNGIDINHQIERAQKAVVDHLQGDIGAIGREKNFSVCDRVLEFMAVIAAESKDRGIGQFSYEAGKHYLVAGDKLYLDVTLMFNIALRYSHSIRQDLEITSVHMFKTLVADENYYISFDNTPFSPRQCLVLDINKMEQKGHDTSLFDNEFGG
ncbi:hypothetical protein RBG11_004232 [Vibrio parahaemolyticus]|nr:hypothetical protein [Vibrio parahaemolyticus]